MPASGPATKAASGMAAISSPASSGERPSTSCRRWLKTSSTPISAPEATTAASTPEEKRRSRNRVKSISGWVLVVTRTGAAGLSIDAVAKAAGITKGGVQYYFGTKEQLIQAMLRRWGDGFEAEVVALAGDQADKAALVRGHIAASCRIDATEDSRAAVMMAALLQSPEQIAETREWYNGRMAGIEPASEEGQRLRLAFLASEGAFFLRAFGLIDLDKESWKATFADILAWATSPVKSD